jgi:hypothetical protein
VAPIRTYIPPFHMPPLPFDLSIPLPHALVAADLEAFEESCLLLEVLALDDEDSLEGNGVPPPSLCCLQAVYSGAR